MINTLKTHKNKFLIVLASTLFIATLLTPLTAKLRIIYLTISIIFCLMQYQTIENDHLSQKNKQALRQVITISIILVIFILMSKLTLIKLPEISWFLFIHIIGFYSSSFNSSNYYHLEWDRAAILMMLIIPYCFLLFCDNSKTIPLGLVVFTNGICLAKIAKQINE